MSLMPTFSFYLAPTIDTAHQNIKILQKFFNPIRQLSLADRGIQVLIVLKAQVSYFDLATEYLRHVPQPANPVLTRLCRFT